jgi:hypothetical protein
MFAFFLQRNGYLMEEDSKKRGRSILYGTLATQARVAIVKHSGQLQYRDKKNDPMWRSFSIYGCLFEALFWNGLAQPVFRFV